VTDRQTVYVLIKEESCQLDAAREIVSVYRTEEACRRAVAVLEALQAENSNSGVRWWYDCEPREVEE
jgi:hypothetical protein